MNKKKATKAPVKKINWKKLAVPALVVVGILVLGNGYLYAHAKVEESAFAKKVNEMAAVGSLGITGRSTSTPSGYGIWHDDVGRERIVTGEVIEKSHSVFKIKVGFFRTYIVGFNPNTRYFDRNWHPLTLDDVVMGNRVSVFGMLNEEGRAITTLVLRDISLPSADNQTDSNKATTTRGNATSSEKGR